MAKSGAIDWERDRNNKVEILRVEVVEREGCKEIKVRKGKGINWKIITELVRRRGKEVVVQIARMRSGGRYKRAKEGVQLSWRWRDRARGRHKSEQDEWMQVKWRTNCY